MCNIFYKICFFNSHINVTNNATVSPFTVHNKQQINRKTNKKLQGRICAENPQRNVIVHLVFRVFRSGDVQCHWQPSAPVSTWTPHSKRSHAGNREATHSRGSR